MSTELLCLLWSTPLGFIYLNAQVITLWVQQGPGNYQPNRDLEPELGIHAGRAARALRNFLETYPLFIGLVAVAELSGRHDTMTTYGALLYVAARIGYLPLYITGLSAIRSTFWSLGMIGLGLIFIGILI
jgi:uncharacterized MAPEG superfamily protein